jgi:hypothetical protein
MVKGPGVERVIKYSNQVYHNLNLVGQTGAAGDWHRRLSNAPVTLLGTEGSFGAVNSLQVQASSSALGFSATMSA